MKDEVAMARADVGEDELAETRVTGPLLGAGEFPAFTGFGLGLAMDEGGQAYDFFAGRAFENSGFSGEDADAFHLSKLEGQTVRGGVDDEAVSPLELFQRGVDFQNAETGFVRDEGKQQICAFIGFDTQGNFWSFRIAAPEIEEEIVAEGGLERPGDVGDRDFEAGGARFVSGAKFRRAGITGIKAGDTELNGG